MSPMMTTLATATGWLCDLFDICLLLNGLFIQRLLQQVRVLVRCRYADMNHAYMHAINYDSLMSEQTTASTTTTAHTHARAIR